jgi:STE24 endopeptidase
MKNIKFVLSLVVFFLGTKCFADPAVEAEVQNYLAKIPPEQLLKSNAYFEGGYWMQLWDLLLALGISFLMMRSGLSVKLREMAFRFTHNSFFRSFLYFAQFMVVMTVLTLPLSIYRDYFREHQYGLSNLDFAHWLLEVAKAGLVGILLGGLFFSLIYWIIKRAPKIWWSLGALTSVLFLAFVMLIFPVFLSPIFNTYKPLEQGPIKDSILSMARSNGVDASEVYQFDASKQSKRISANVSGLGATTRISLNDNLLNRTTPAEIRAVMGHEMGHFVMHHVTKLLIYLGLLLTFGFFVIYWLMNRILHSWGPKFKVLDPGDVAGAPILFALFTLFMFLATPISNSMVRSSEAEADIFGLNLAREPDGFAEVALKLSEYRKLSSGYWEEIFFFDHPSGENRIRTAMTWKKENLKN